MGGAERWRRVARVVLEAGRVEAFFWRCSCRANGRENCAEVPDNPIFGEVWGACPFGEARHPAFAAACRLLGYAEIAPLADWPHGYTAGVVEAMLGIRQAHADARRRAEDEARAAMAR